MTECRNFTRINRMEIGMGMNLFFCQRFVAYEFFTSIFLKQSPAFSQE